MQDRLEEMYRKAEGGIAVGRGGLARGGGGGAGKPHLWLISAAFWLKTITSSGILASLQKFMDR